MGKTENKTLSILNIEEILISNFGFNENALLKLPIQIFSFAFLLFSMCFFLSTPVLAQYDEEYPTDVVPPPLNFISKSEKKQLKAETKMKKRIKLSLELMDARLVKAKTLLDKNKFQASLNEIGKFRGLLINTLKFMKSKEGSRGSFKNFKKLEINLRNFLPKLELIRREMPYKYGFHIKRTMFFVRDSRTEALNPLFDNTVLSSPDKKSK